MIFYFDSLAFDNHQSTILFVSTSAENLFYLLSAIKYKVTFAEASRKN
jgi:phosphatidate phosphatase APP1